MPKRTNRGDAPGWLWILGLLILIITLICGGSTFLGPSDHELLFTPIEGYPPGWHQWFGPAQHPKLVSVLIVPEFPLIGTLAPIVILAVALFVYKFRGKPLILKR